MTHFVFVHGWGFGPEIWRDVMRHLPLKKSSCVNLGFFAEPAAPILDGDEDVVLVTHSMGLLWALDHLPKNLRALVAINGFARFEPQKSLRLMQQKFTAQPNQVLADFHARIGGTVPSAPLREEALAQGLAILAEKDGSAALSRLSCPILALCAKDDPLIKPDHSAAMTAANPKIKLHWAEKGGHILPMTRPEWCAGLIAEAVHDRPRHQTGNQEEILARRAAV